MTTCATYDSAGNVTQYGSAYTYDDENRLTSTAGYTYVYDGDGKRVKKSSGSLGTLYWTGVGSDTLAESDLSGNISAEYGYFNGMRMGRRDVPSNTAHLYLLDHLNTARMVVTPTSQQAITVDEEADYFPYGGEIVIQGSTTATKYKFTGKERDTESGLDNFQARYYTSNLGRFMTPDWAARPTAVPYAVFGDPQSLNLYGYVRNDPVTRADADGHGLDCRGNNASEIGCQMLFAFNQEHGIGQQSANEQTRSDIAGTAQKYNGSTDWSYDKQKDNFACRTHKCNKFVYDVTKEAGAEAMVIGGDGKPRAPLASEWADPNVKIKNWRVLAQDESPQPGDVAAYKLSGGGSSYTGHSGIVMSVDTNGTVHGMAAHENVVGPDDKFNSTPTRTVTYRRYEGGH